MHDDYGEVDGAYATCWVNEPTVALADAQARAFLEELGWDIEEREEALRVQASDYPLASEGQDRIEQARLDGLVVTLHRWAVGAPDDDEDSSRE